MVEFQQEGVPEFESPNTRKGLQLWQFWQCEDEREALARFSLRAIDEVLKTSRWPLFPKCAQKMMKNVAVDESLFQMGRAPPTARLARG